MRIISINSLGKLFHVALAHGLRQKSSSMAECIKLELTVLLLLIKQGLQTNLSVSLLSLIWTRVAAKVSIHHKHEQPKSYCDNGYTAAPITGIIGIIK